MRTYRTSEVADIIGIHPNTVRFYEEWGLITKPEREKNGYRIFTELHLQQIRLARMAFQIEVLQNGLRKKIVEVVKTTAKCDFERALCITQEYISMLQKERVNAEEAIEIVQDILSGAEHTPHKDEEELLMKRNGYRVYTYKDIQRLKIIRSLRCANYSLEAILRMLRQLSQNPNADIREALNTPGQNEAIMKMLNEMFPDEIRHLADIKQKIDASLTEAEERVLRLDREYRQAKQYMVDSYSEMDRHEKLQNERLLEQTDRTGVFAVEKREKVAKLKDSPYFARIDFSPDGSDIAFPYYIGRFGFEYDGEQLIFDWRAPISGMFYDYDAGPAGFDAPVGRIEGELTRKRQFKIKNGVMEYVLESTTNVQDEVLQKELAHTFDDKMKLHEMH